MDCQACAEEIPDDSLFCPECGARQDPSKSGAVGGRNFGVVSPQAIQASKEMQSSDAAGATANLDASLLNQIASEMSGRPAADPVDDDDMDQNPKTRTDAVVDSIVEAERAEKADARSEWLTMNQKTASGVLAGIAGGELPSNLATSSGSARFLDDADDVSQKKARVRSNLPSASLLRRMAEVAVRRVARKRGVAVESPQVAMTEEDTVQVNVTYIDDGRVLDTPPDLSNAFEHAISTELALKGFDIDIEIALFRSEDGIVELVWGEVVGDAAAGAAADDGDEDLFACEDCGHYPIRESDPACPDCGAQFIDDGDDWEGAPPAARSAGGPPGGGSAGGGPPRGPALGGGGAPRGPSRGPGGPAASGSGGPPSKGPGGPPSRGPGGPPSRSPDTGPPSRGGGPPSKGPGGPPSKGPGGPPSKGPGGPPSKGPGGPPSKGPGGPPRKGPSGPPRKGPPR